METIVVKRIALVAHDNRKKDMIEWVKYNRAVLSQHRIVCTGTTGRLVEETLTKTDSDEEIVLKHDVKKLKSGPLGGDQQLGALIAENKVDIMIFFWDAMQAQPHDVDVKALLRISTVYNIPVATNRSTADFMISSPLFNSEYVRKIKNYKDYIHRGVDFNN